MTDIVINNIIAYLNNFTIYIYKELKMKKLLLASLITATSFGASASSVITFDDSSFNGIAGSSISFDKIQFNNDMANVTQTDTDLSGDASGEEAFSEFGQTVALTLTLGGTNTSIDPAYEIFLNYSFSGLAEFNGTFIDVQFDASHMTGLYIDTDVNSTFDIASSTQIVDFSILPGGFCAVFVSAGSGVCDIQLGANFTPSYFTNTSGEDLSTVSSASAELVVTVEDIVGFQEDYANVGDTQNFTITHDGNMTFDVPEPASVAILGLGLLGFAGARRRKA